MFKKMSIAFMCVLVSSAAAFAVEPVFPFEGEGGVNIPMDFMRYHGPEMENVDEYGESWFFFVQNEDDTLLFLMLSSSNIGPGTFNGSVDLQIYPVGGKMTNVHAEYSRDKVKGSTSAYDITVGPNRAWGAPPTINVSFNESNYKANLTFSNLLPSYRYQDGMVKFGAEKDKVWTLGLNSPRAKVTGTVTAGGKTYNINGNGYHDPGWSTIILPYFVKKWQTLRVFNDDITIVFHSIFLQEEYGSGQIKFGLVGKDGKIVASTKGYQYTPSNLVKDPNSKYKYPTKFDVKIDAGKTKVTGTVEVVSVIDSVDVLSMLNFVTRTAVKLFVSDTRLIRLMGKYELDVTIGEETKHISGTGLVEDNHY
jgi:hypothetical protein